MMSGLRVEAVGFIDYYCAVYRRDGIPDEFLVDANGKPRRFGSAYDAISAARAAIFVARDADASYEVPDLLGVERWRQEKRDKIATERAAVFGGDLSSTIQRNGREVLIERRRLR